MKITTLLTATVFAALAVTSVEARLRTTALPAEEGKRLLEQVASTAEAINVDAVNEQAFLRDNAVSHEGHAETISTIKYEVNQMGQNMSRLQNAYATLPAWEQKAVDETLPVLKEIASNTEAAIKYVDENETNFNTGEYRTVVGNIRHESEKLHRAVRDFLKLAKARDTEHKADEDLRSAGAE